MRKTWIATALIVAAGSAAALIGVTQFGQGDAARADLAWDATGTAAATAATDAGKLAAAGIITTIAGNGVDGFAGDGGSAKAAALGEPTDVKVDAAGNVYVVSRNRVRRITPAGIITTIAGNGLTEFAPAGTTPTGDNGAATTARFDAISGIAVDTAGNLYISDRRNRRIRKVSANGVIRTIAGVGTDVLTDAAVPFSGEGAQALTASLSAPGRIAVDAAGNVYFSDYVHIRRIAPNGVLTTIAGNGQPGDAGDGGPALQAQLQPSSGLAVDAAGNVHASQGGLEGRVRRISPAGIITTVVGGGRAGRDPVATTMKVPGSGGVTLDAQGNLFMLAVTAVHRINPLGILDTVAGNAELPLGDSDSYGFAGDGGPATLALMDSPAGLATDAAGNLYIADRYNHRIRKVTPTAPAPTPHGLDAFHPYVEVPLAGTPGAVAIADVNGDRRPDLLATVDPTPEAWESPDQLRIYLQQPGGTLAAPRTLAMQWDANELATGDFNRDGIQDIVVKQAHQLSVVLGRADGQFVAQSLPRAAEYGLYSPTVMDMNRDGHLDIVVAAQNRLLAYYGDGKGGFPATGAPWGDNDINTLRMSTADFTGDGASDLYLFSEPERGFDVLANRNGTFVQSQHWFGSDMIYGWRMATGDFNSDGRTDVLHPVVHDRKAYYNLYAQDAGGKMVVTPARIPILRTGELLARADIQNDGVDDLLALHDQGRGLGYQPQVNGVLDTEVKYLVPESWVPYRGGVQPGLATGDLTGDGCDDVALFYGGDAILVYRSKRCRPRQVPHDFDGDRRADVVWRNTAIGSNDLWRAASLSQRLQLAGMPTDWTLAGIGDFGGDGKADLLWRHGPSGANELWHSGLKTQRQVLGTEVSASWKVAGVGDFNNDGRDDLFWRNAGTGANGVWWSASRANAQVAAAVPDQNWQVVGVGDFTGDAKDDLLWRNAATGANDLWGSGTQSQRRAVTAVTSLDWKVVAVGDFNGDRVADIFWRHATTGANVIWLYGRATAQQPVTTVADPNWIVAATADYDGDGKTDVLWRHRISGANELWSEANVKFRKVLTPVTNTAWQVMPRN